MPYFRDSVTASDADAKGGPMRADVREQASSQEFDFFMGRWAGAARPAGDRLVLGRHGHLRGNGHVRGQADPRAVHVVARDVAYTALGAGVLRGRRRDLGDELDHGLRAHAGGGSVSALEQSISVTPEYRHVEKVVTPEPSLALDGTILKWYDIAL